MEAPDSGYVTLSVRELRYLGKWHRLSKIIKPVNVLRSVNVGFIVPVKHIPHNGLPNNFPAVEFERIRHFTIIDTKAGLPALPIRVYEALTAEMYDEHLAVLHSALTDKDCCVLQTGETFESNLYRL